MGIATREEWLTIAVERLWPTVEKHGKVPDSHHVICSWPPNKIKRIIGVCYKPVWTKDGSTYITVSPLLEDPRHVLHTLLHEMIHAIGFSGHGKKFKAVCEKAGLLGEANGELASLEVGTRSPELNARFEEILKELGEYPHVALVPPEKKKSESSGEKAKAYTRCDSPDPNTEYWVYVKTKLLEQYGPPLDPITKLPMKVSEHE